MKWIQELLKKVCQNNQFIEQNGSIRFNDYSISIQSEENLYAIKVTNLINISLPKISKPLYYDEIEDHLLQTINSL